MIVFIIIIIRCLYISLHFKITSLKILKHKF